MAYCSEKNIAVVPQGGNTGLVGGSVPVYDELILSTEKMDKVVSFDSVSGILVAQSGCILEKLDNYLQEKGFIMPLDLGAKGSCHIGGNVATNAGGLRVVRYGSLKGNVLGLEVVTADGTIIKNLSGLRKDNTGYDLKQLFIGSEGTLGIITGVSILAAVRPTAYSVALLALNNFDDIQSTFVLAKQQLGEILSAYEFFDRGCLDLTISQLGYKDPLSDTPAPFYVVLETSGSNPVHDQQKLEQFFSSGMEEGLIIDGTISQDVSQFKKIWLLREEITSALARAGKPYKYDLSIPISVMYDLVVAMKKRLAHLPSCRVYGYGHVGDSNLHLNILSSQPSDEVLNLIEPYVYEWTASYGGSISAEHGLGLMKRNQLHYSKSKQEIKFMSDI
eukprot:CAMPEP_0174277288 /NCGR_PEP_ID=MMETSP0439-20130205/60851_1 /TAXON_ID=0 /ORGANISM="Stereomyxa ramosa, Strain Chinc5" /LENGTH=389 /DNA_ID=CAMNT_0015369597 /DNA_START=501 /DNA_END=1667 /DNA_ORIENTATION=+